MRGGYRGSGRGRGHGRGSRGDMGPQLPTSLINQLGGGDDDGHYSSGNRRSKGGLTRKQKRKEERTQKKKANVDYFRQRHVARQQQQIKAAKEQRLQEQEDAKRKLSGGCKSPLEPEPKRARLVGSGISPIPQAEKAATKLLPQKKDRPVTAPVTAASTAFHGRQGSKPASLRHPKTRFEELLSIGFEGRNDPRAFEEDMRLQRMLEKKLGMKKSSKRSGPEDNLDKLLDGITAGSETLPSYFKVMSPNAGHGHADDEDDDDGIEGLEDDDDSDEESEEDEDEDEGVYDEVEDNEGEGEEEEGRDEEDDFGLSDLVNGETSEDEEDAGGDDDEDSEEGEERGWESDEGEEDEDSDQQRLRSSLLASSSAPQSATGLSSEAAPTAAAPGSKYVPPALRAQQAAESGRDGGEGNAAVERRITGLINRLAESNIQGIIKDVVALYNSEGRRVVTRAVSGQILTAASEGPRATEQFAAIAAAFVSSLAASCQSQEVGATFLAELADRQHEAYLRKDSLALHNLAMVLAHLFSCGLVRADVLYGYLGLLRNRLDEPDVDVIVTILGSVGLQLRGDDPMAMKEFVVGVHAKAAERGQQGGLSKRAQMMLDLVVDVKNNKKGADGGGGRRAAAVLGPSLLKWLRQSGVEEVQLRNIGWDKLLDKQRRKGMWWLPAAGEALGGGLLGRGGKLGSMGGASDQKQSEEEAELLKLAAEQRMNTDVRRAVFVAIMGSDDCIEAHEKLLRLPLKGEQEREVVRVLLQCCMAEKSWNPFYGLLALKLARSSKAHRMTMQFSLWDQFKALNSITTAQLSSLARLNSLLVAKGVIPLTMIKVASLTDLAPRALFFWRLFFRHLLSSCKDAGEVQEVFRRVTAVRKKLPTLVPSLLAFIRGDVGPWLATQDIDSVGTAPGSARKEQLDELLRRVRVAERVLAAAAAGGRADGSVAADAAASGRRQAVTEDEESDDDELSEDEDE